MLKQVLLNKKNVLLGLYWSDFSNSFPESVCIEQGQRQGQGQY